MNVLSTSLLISIKKNYSHCSRYVVVVHCGLDLHFPNGLDEAQAGIKIARRSINNLRYTGDTTLMAESKEKLKSLLMKVKEESGKSWLKIQHQKTKIMASGPITSWQRDGETVADFIFWAPKSLQMVTSAIKLKDAYSLEEKL